ncbi:hypothetical protein VPH47_08220 [Stenotrophomonas sp. WED208]|uniref:hypothetical protein n=1 Tax=Stenotrophomonas sp. WED208 TaxID=3112800 RepID=UPI0034D43CD9
MNTNSSVKREEPVGETAGSTRIITPRAKLDLIRDAVITTIIDAEVGADMDESGIPAACGTEIDTTAAVDAQPIIAQLRDVPDTCIAVHFHATDRDSARVVLTRTNAFTGRNVGQRVLRQALQGDGDGADRQILWVVRIDTDAQVVPDNDVRGIFFSDPPVEEILVPLTTAHYRLDRT